MSPEAINERIKDLEAQAEHMKAALHACLGAIQDCKFWLTQLESKDASSQIEI